MIRTTLSADDLERYVLRVVGNLLPDDRAVPQDLRPLVALALKRLEHCFSQIRLKYYTDGGEAFFDHAHSDHFAAFLYFLANTVWSETGDEAFPTRLFYANKIMHSLDLFYSVSMPSVFLLVHPVGTVLGRAAYSDYLVVYQNCTVGADTDVYPAFGKGVVLYSRTSVIGSCRVGDNVIFGANSMIVDTDVPSDTLVVGQYPSHRLLRSTHSVRERCFGTPRASV